MRAWLAVLALAALPTLPAAAASPFDGVYGGTWTHNGGTLGAGRCPDGGGMSLRVTDGSFPWRGGGQPTRVQIAPDGTFNGQSGQRFISGRVANGKLTATTRDQYCVYDWALSR
jgi:hypothetical protein